jgi:hypothetical protein
LRRLSSTGSFRLSESRKNSWNARAASRNYPRSASISISACPNAGLRTGTAWRLWESRCGFRNCPKAQWCPFCRGQASFDWEKWSFHYQSDRTSLRAHPCELPSPLYWRKAARRSWRHSSTQFCWFCWKWPRAVRWSWANCYREWSLRGGSIWGFSLVQNVKNRWRLSGSGRSVAPLPSY